MPIVSDTPLARRVSGKPRVHVTRRLLPSVEARMAELFDVVTNPVDAPLGRDGLIAAMRDADVLVPTVTDKIDAAMLEEAGDRLGLIANFGAGIDHIDLAAARAKKIIVTNTPGVFTDDTADLTMMLILSVPRRLGEGSRLVITGDRTQVDLPRGTKSGLAHVIKVLKDVPGISFTHFQPKDVVRHPLVQRIVEAYERFEEQQDEPGKGQPHA